MLPIVSASSPRICIHVAHARDARAIERFERRLAAASRRSKRRDWATALRAPLPSVEAAVGEPVSVIARDRDSGIVVGHATAVADSDGAANVAVRVAQAYEDHDIGAKLVEGLMRGIASMIDAG